MTKDFEEDFVDKTLALVVRDQSFVERVDGLITESFFDSEVSKYIFNSALHHFKKYGVTPTATALGHKFKEDQAANIIRKELVSLIGTKFKTLYKEDISDREFFIDRISDFCRKQATVKAVVQSAEIIDSGGDLNSIMPLMQKALDVGASDLTTAYDFKENIAQRAELRKARLKGEVDYNSVTTGFKEFDACLFRRGWGRSELTLYMGPSKSGKSIALLDHALRAAERGYNVLFVSLEVATEIQVDRMDSNISGVRMDDLYVYIDKVQEKVTHWASKAANLKLHEYPSGTFRVSDLRRLIKRYQSVGVLFDLVVVDYADIMLSEAVSTEGIDRSKQVLLDLRALAQSENVALLSATQTNREGAKADLVTAIHVAEDYNKIRIADLVISINQNDIEKECGEGRLYFAASRNQKAVTITVKRNLSIMKHIIEIVEVK